MIEGQEGVTWEQWLALALATEAAGLGGLFRSDHYRSIVRGEPAGVARRVGDARGTRRAHRADPARDDGLARHLPSPLGAREERRDGRPRLGRQGRARHRRRLVRGRARELRVPLRHAARAARRARSPARRDHAPVDGGRGRPASPAPAAPPADHRRRAREAADGRRRDPPRRRVQHDLPLRRGGARAGDRRGRGRAGRRPCAPAVLDDDRLRRRPRRRRGPRAALRRGGTSRGATTRRRSAGRSTRSPRACATTRPRASSGRCSSTSSTRTSRWSRSSARSPRRSPHSLLRPASACYHGGSDGRTFMRASVGLAAILGVALVTVAGTAASAVGVRSCARPERGSSEWSTTPGSRCGPAPSSCIAA